MTKLNLDQITIDPAIQARAAMNLGVVAEYAAAMENGDVFPPIIAFREGCTYLLADGFHRVEAARQAELETIEADIRDGGYREAFLYAVGANATHGLRRTNADKRRAVIRLLEDDQWSRWSDREIARRCAVSNEFVSRLRRSLSSVDSDRARTYTTRHGTVATMNTANIGRSQSAAIGVPEDVAETLTNTEVAALQIAQKVRHRLGQETYVYLDQIRTDGGTQVRVELDLVTIVRYAEAMEAGDAFPPIVVYLDGNDRWLADGHLRVAAARHANRAKIEADVRHGSRRDAILYAVSADDENGLLRTRPDRLRAVEMMLADHTWCNWQDREIARRCGIDNREVGRVRLESGLAVPTALTPIEYPVDAGSESSYHLTEVEAAATKIVAGIKARRAEHRRRERARLLKEPVQPPNGKFKCLVVDPPWPNSDVNRVRFLSGIRYPSMTIEELERLPIHNLADDEGCHLFLWSTHRFLPDALRLAEVWGFWYHCLLTWTKDFGFTPYSWQYSTEHVVFARRGNLPLERLGLRLDFHAKVREHSRKPDEFYDLVLCASPGPRLDMFAREEREGFEAWGNEVGKFETPESRQ